MTTRRFGSEERQGDAPEDAGGAGAVHLGGLVEVARDRLQAGEQDQRVEAHVRPDRDADGGGEGQVRSVSQLTVSTPRVSTPS